MTRDDIAAVIKKVPDLNDFGVGLFNHGRGLSADEQAEHLRQDRERLLASTEDCARVCEWLGTLERTKTVNDRHSSCDDSPS